MNIKHLNIMKKTNLFVVSVILSLFSFYCQAQFTQPSIPEQEVNTLRIMSYNIRNARGTDSGLNYDRVADVIYRVAPEIVAIQEADSATQRSGSGFVLNEIAARTMMYHTYGAIGDFEGGKLGLGILSKEKPLYSRTISLPGKEEARGLLIVEFDKYIVCSTQLSLTPEDRDASIPIIFDAIKEYKKPLFLAGDMNCDFESSSQNALQSKFHTLNDFKQATIPVINAPNIPYGCIDFIYGYDKSRTYSVLARQVVSVPGSDHYPVFVDVRVSAAKEDIFRTKPYLQKPINNGITISWLTNVPVHSWVEYGKDGKLDQQLHLYVDGQMLCNNKTHHFRLENLEPGVTYSYRVVSREITLYQAYKKEFGHTAYSDTYTFRIPSPKDTDFTALVFNDVHKNFDLMERFAKQIKDANLQYDFVFYNGDCIDDPKDEDQAVSFMKVLNEIAIAEKAPVFYLRGNHEIRNAYSIGLRSLFDYINGTTYGAFNWGDTRIVMLDCGEDKPDSTWVYYGLNNFDGIRADQAEFLKKELVSNEFKQATKRILIHHIPIYGGREGGYNPCRAMWGDLLDKAPFDICINGHTHRFAYHPKGSAGNNFPIVVGGGSQPNGAYMLIIQKKGKQLTFRALDVDGNEKLKLDL